jgi:hypothetical protein
LSDAVAAASSSSSDDAGTLSGAGTMPPLSGDYTEVALIFTEVLQLQVSLLFLPDSRSSPSKNRPKDAVQVLSKAIEILNTDLVHAKHHRQASNSPNNTLVPMSPASMQSLVTTNTKPPLVSTAEFEQLKKMKGHCHRRLGSVTTPTPPLFLTVSSR